MNEVKRITEIPCETEIFQEEHSILVRLETDSQSVIRTVLNRLIHAGIVPNLVHVRLSGTGQKNTEFDPNWVLELRAMGVDLQVSIEI